MDSLLLINKPSGLSSRAVVDAVEAWFPGSKAGHAGTLDPLATGLMVVCLGTATRLIEYVQRMGKTYEANIRLGATSTTDDAGGEIRQTEAVVVPTEAKVIDCLRSFVGQVEQVPPAYSAIHVAGRRAYRLARQGHAVRLAARRVRIDSIRVGRYEYPDLALSVDCGKGTYIRAIARDLGQALGCGGYLCALQRTRIGPFSLTDAFTLEADDDRLMQCVLPLETALQELPKATLPPEVLWRLAQGQRVELPQYSNLEELAAFDEAGRCVAILLRDQTNQTWKAAKVLRRA